MTDQLEETFEKARRVVNALESYETRLVIADNDNYHLVRDAINVIYNMGTELDSLRWKQTNTDTQTVPAIARVFLPRNSGEILHGNHFYTLEHHIVEGYSATEIVSPGGKSTGNPMIGPSKTVWIEVNDD